MKTPWINHTKMEEICSNQMFVYKSSPSKVQNISIALNFICINQERKEADKDISELDSAPSCVDVTTTNNHRENNEINMVPEQHEKNHTNSTHDLDKLSDDIDSKPVPPTESDIMNEMKDFLDKEEVVETHPVDETKDTAQTDSAVDRQQPSGSDFINEMKDSLDKEEVVETHPVDETKDTAQTNSADDRQQPSESDFMNEMKDSLDKEEVVETHPVDETKDTAQTDSVVDYQHPAESDFINENKDFLDKEEVVEPDPDDEPKDTAQTDAAVDRQHPSASDSMNDLKGFFDNNETGETNPPGDTSELMYRQGRVCFMTKKSPFSIHVEIEDFLHAPICGDIVQNTFEFLDLNNKQTPDVNTKLNNTTTYYPEQPDCRLVCSKIHEIVSLTDSQNEGNNNKNNHYRAVAVPLHDSLFTKEESNHNSYVHIRVPVVIGEYKIEIGLKENITFKEEVIGIKEISKEVVLSNFRLVPTVLSQSLNNGTRTVLKGNLFIEGYILQKIEYTALSNKNTESFTPSTQLNQKMVVELIIHILQVQQVRVKR
ncbi:BC_2427 family protein [Neobacillus vireti]|uniref:DUF7852 domain-containing protein n=1 Tax=Neobacillus vireti LMG 21834 TaxID=1131730 RepID=A0AB94ITZ9_9BACI|nr:hypothetical protein [Neobacillus vireti]ETI70525.1 hypothetical protein BAVI_02214 [Neobacillus vireti LMG 21834]